MLFEITENGDLEITVGPAEQAQLRRLREDLNRDGGDLFESDRTMNQVMEELIVTSDLEWVEPAWVGALTAAPILGIFDYEEPMPKLPPDARGEYRITGSSAEEGVSYAPVIRCWGFIEYALRSPLTDLADRGCVVFKKGEGDAD